MSAMSQSVCVVAVADVDEGHVGDTSAKGENGGGEKWKGRYQRRPATARGSRAARSVDQRVGGAVESGRREGAQRGMYFTGGGEERERGGGGEGKPYPSIGAWTTVLSIVLPKETRRAMCRQVILVRTGTTNLLTAGEVKNNCLDHQIVDIKVSTIIRTGTY